VSLRADPASSQWLQARSVIRRWGWNVTSYQILNPGFSFWRDPRYDAVVGFIERHGVWVVGGAPVCADEQLLQVMHAFESDAAQTGCGVVYFCAEERLASLAARDPARVTFPIGAQPMFLPHALTAELHGHASLRAQLNRARNKGLSVHVWNPGDVTRIAQLRRCLDLWRQQRGLPELHFLVETQTFQHLEDRLVFYAERADEPVAFTVVSPIPARDSWLVEQIVRTPAAPNGTAELMLNDVATELESRDARMVTLGLAPLARRGEAVVDQAPGWLRALFSGLRVHGRNFYNFEGLEAFKAKFHPHDWKPVYASVGPDTSLPRALLAITTAFSGEPLRRFIPHSVGRALAREAQRMLKR
jgi:phosphatidylglycerol lysyltransferase